MDTVLNGGKIPLEIERWIVENGNKVFETQTIYVDVMKGVDNNEILILRDQGNVINESCKGDVKIFIKIENDTLFQRKGLDLYMDKKISSLLAKWLSRQKEIINVLKINEIDEINKVQAEKYLNTDYK
jgi:DnaJ-class molecular chaperone